VVQVASAPRTAAIARAAGAHVVPLRADVVYRAPSGRRCQWLPDPRVSDGRFQTVPADALFVYLDMPAGGVRRGRAAVWNDGFRLAAANWKLLREVKHAPAR